MANIFSNPDTVRPPGVNYHHSVEVPAGSRLLYVAGQTGLADDDTSPEPDDASDSVRKKQFQKNRIANSIL